MPVCISACPGLLSCILLACPRLYVHVSMAASLHGVHACMFMSACLQVCVSMSKSMPDFFTILLVKFLSLPKSQACLHIHVCMSVNACLHVHVCLAAFACPFGFFSRFCSCHTPQVPGHVCISLSACPYMYIGGRIHRISIFSIFMEQKNKKDT